MGHENTVRSLTAEKSWPQPAQVSVSAWAEGSSVKGAMGKRWW